MKIYTVPELKKNDPFWDWASINYEEPISVCGKVQQIVWGPFNVDFVLNDKSYDIHGFAPRRFYNMLKECEKVDRMVLMEGSMVRAESPPTVLKVEQMVPQGRHNWGQDGSWEKISLSDVAIRGESSYIISGRFFSQGGRYMLMNETGGVELIRSPRSNRFPYLVPVQMQMRETEAYGTIKDGNFITDGLKFPPFGYFSLPLPKDVVGSLAIATADEGALALSFDGGELSVEDDS